MWSRHKLTIIFSALMLILYLSLFGCATSGYGYMGDDDFDDGPSFFYFGGVGHYYPGRTVRGTGMRGGGFRGGK